MRCPEGEPRHAAERFLGHLWPQSHRRHWIRRRCQRGCVEEWLVAFSRECADFRWAGVCAVLRWHCVDIVCRGWRKKGKKGWPESDGTELGRICVPHFVPQTRSPHAPKARARGFSGGRGRVSSASSVAILAQAILAQAILAQAVAAQACRAVLSTRFRAGV